jgi:hypothetical protein
MPVHSEIDPVRDHTPDRRGRKAPRGTARRIAELLALELQAEAPGTREAASGIGAVTSWNLGRHSRVLGGGIELYEHPDPEANLDWLLVKAGKGHVIYQERFRNASAHGNVPQGIALALMTVLGHAVAATMTEDN